MDSRRQKFFVLFVTLLPLTSIIFTETTLPQGYYDNVGDSASAKEDCAKSIQIIKKDYDRLITLKHPLSKEETSCVLIRHGSTIGETSVPSRNTRIIIQIEGMPLAQVKNASISMASAAAKLKQARDLVKEEVVLLENIARQTKGLPSLDSKQIIPREYSCVFNGLAATVSQEALSSIEKLPHVKKVHIDREVKAVLTESVPLIQADRVWSDIGVTGGGIIVAVIDTGIDYTHPDLGGCFGLGCKVMGGYDFINDDQDPMDDSGHGTHVAGIVAANGNIKGIAPDAQLMALKVLDQYGYGSFSDVIAGIERAVDPDQNPDTDDAVQVINMSLEGPGDPDDPVSQAVDNAVAAGVVIVVAAGNSGPGYGTISSPGGARHALTVGATDKSDQIASFSSRGPAPLTYHIKPEVNAPGVSIFSTVPKGTCFLCDPSGYKVLDGTSMAAPHVAGAAALLREIFPAWTPQQIKAAIMEGAKNLLLDSFTQGSGRINVYDSAISSALVDPGILSLGLDDVSQPSFTRSEFLTITNLSSSTINYSLFVQGNFPTDLTISITPSSLILHPGETNGFTFKLAVNNTTVPNAPPPTLAYEGAILATSMEGDLRIPFAFMKSPVMVVSFDAEPWILTVHNGLDLFLDYYNFGLSKSMLVPEGTYDVNVVFQDATTFVLREGIPVYTNTRVDISKSEAIYPITIVPIDKDGNLITQLEGMVDSFFKHKTSGFARLISYGEFPTTFWFSNMSDAYLFEATILHWPTQPGNLSYVFYGHAKNGINSPLTFQYMPSDFRNITIPHSVDPGVDQIVPWNWICTPPGPYWSVCSGKGGVDYGYTPLSSPMKEQAYLLSLPYPEFSLGYFKKDVFTASDSQLLYTTPYFTLTDDTQINGYLFPECIVPAFSTMSNHLPFGIGPYSWFGRFENWYNEIQIWPALGSFAWLYLGQIRDLRPHDPLPYELYQNGTLLQTGTFPNIGNPWSSPYFASIPVTPGSYSLKIPFSNYFIGDQEGFALMEASFDTQASDPNPPYLTQFNILEEDNITDTLISGQGLVIFKIFDDVGMDPDSVSLYYDSGTGWQSLPVMQNGPNEYHSNLSFPVSDTFVSLKVVAADMSGNFLINEMKPAFRLIPIRECVEDSDCPDDGLFCNGTENCDESAGQCVSSGDPCVPSKVCNEENDVCINEVTVLVDIKPNPLNLKCQGVLPAEVMGTEEFDVASIDPDSLRLTREGIAGGVAPIRYNITDGVTPAHADMLLKFRVPEVVETLMLNELAGQTIALVLTGETVDGRSFRGQDTVLLLGNIVKECHSDFDCDADVDGTDAFTFKHSFGRSTLTNPCSDADLCDGDFDKDSDVDGNDAFAFKVTYGTVLYWPR